MATYERYEEISKLLKTYEQQQLLDREILIKNMPDAATYLEIQKYLNLACTQIGQRSVPFRLYPVIYKECQRLIAEHRAEPDENPEFMLRSKAVFWAKFMVRRIDAFCRFYGLDIEDQDKFEREFGNDHECTIC